MADVDYKWKGGKGVEIVSSQMAQFDLLRVVTENEASTNSKGRNKETVESVLLFYIFSDNTVNYMMHKIRFWCSNV